MTILDRRIEVPDALDVLVDKDSLRVELRDGRAVITPLAWYPRLQHASQSERDNWLLIGRGEGIHWPDIDEDISVAGMIAGERSGESLASFKKWLQAR